MLFRIGWNISRKHIGSYLIMLHMKYCKMIPYQNTKWN